MKIPDKLKVGGTVYDIEICDCISDEPDGLFVYNKSKIIVVRRESEQAMKQTFFHELFHAIDCAYNGGNLEEDVIERLSQGMYQVVKDNPSIF